MKKVKIYCLYDPISCKIRYIGRTTKTVLSHRLIEHITKSKYYKTYKPGGKPTHKEAWVLSLLKNGVEPKIKLLCEIDGWKESHVFERSLILKYKDKMNLVNFEDRGDGGLNHIVRDSSKALISRKLKEYYSKNVSTSCIKVYSYDNNGNKLLEFSSAVDCASHYNIMPSKVCQVLSGDYKQWKGVRFSREDVDNIGVFVKTKKKSYSISKKIKVINTINNEEFVFNEIKEAERSMGFPGGSVSQYFKRNQIIYKNKYKFILLG
jgi:hypothetical protein